MKRMVILVMMCTVLTGCVPPCFTPKYADANKGQEGGYFLFGIVNHSDDGEQW